jgi:hypothetical protein
VFEEHVQPAEDAELVDPALAPIDTAARTRVGYRVRCAPTTETTCKQAWDGVTRVAGSTGALSIQREAPSAPPDPCAPPGDPFGQLPEGLFRVEVIDAGSAATARFGWSFENGGAAVAVASIAGAEVTLAPSAAVKFANGDRVEVSWLARREDRKPHQALYTVIAPPQTGAGGDVLTLERPITAPAGAVGLAVRRWDGDVVGATAAVTAPRGGVDLGVRFTAGAGDYEVGDWWGARVREEEGSGIEARTAAAPDGVIHAFAPLALVDLDARIVLHDCRPTFLPLTDLQLDAGACTVSVRPGDDLQAALDRIPPDGGELCMAAGVYPLATPLAIVGRRRIVVTGAGGATVLRATATEAALVVEQSSGIEVNHVRVEGGAPAGAGDPGLNGAITVRGSTDVEVADCAISCPGSKAGHSQTCITLSPTEARVCDGIRIVRNRLEIGPWETGILAINVGALRVSGNDLGLRPDVQKTGLTGAEELVLRRVRQLIARAIQAQGAPGTKPVEIPGTTAVNVLVGTDGGTLIEALAPRIAAASGARLGGPKALAQVARRVLDPDVLQTLPKAAIAVITGARSDLLVAGQGIVLGGTHAGTVQILDNLIEDVVQGVHVGFTFPGGRTQGLVDELMISRNHIHVLVPAFYDRDRFAIFVGNFNTLDVLDNVASVARKGRGAPLEVPLSVEGIRLYGVFGPYLCVRHTSLRGFTTGVRVVVRGFFESPPQMWLVAETKALGATKVLDSTHPFVNSTTIDPFRNV